MNKKFTILLFSLFVLGIAENFIQAQAIQSLRPEDGLRVMQLMKNLLNFEYCLPKNKINLH